MEGMNLREFLVTNGNSHLHAEVSAFHAELANLARLKETLLVAVGLGIHDPDGLLGVIRLVLVLLLHVHRGPEELRGVGVHGALHQLDMAGHLGARLLTRSGETEPEQTMII